MSTSVFGFSDYKGYLRAVIQDPPEGASSRGFLSRLAEAAKCQRSYLSRVLGDHVHLTPDHAFGIAEFLELAPEESEYLFLLLEHARAGSKGYREHLERKLEQMKRRQEDLAKRLSRPRLEPGEKETAYYSAWYWSAIHIIVSIPRFQTIRAIAEHLALPEALVGQVLESLQRFGLVARKQERWVFSSQTVHVPKESLLVGVHHGNWRQRAVLDAQVPGNDGVHFTVVQSMSRADFELIKHKLLQFIDESARIAGPSREEELVALTCDFFRCGMPCER